MPEEQQPNQQVPHKEQPTKPAKTVQAQITGPYSSYWPLTLAVALSLVLLGIIINPIILAVGVALTIGAIIGWGLERR